MTGVKTTNKELKLAPLTPEHLRVITYIEQYWFKFNGTFPSRESLGSVFPEFDIDSALEHKTFRISLVNRGIDPPIVLQDDSHFEIPIGISREQLAAVLTIINFEDKRSRAAKFKELGVTPQQWQGWLKQPRFKTFLHNLSSANLQDAAYVANEALVRAMDRNDVSAIKFYHEITGRYQPQAQVAQQSQQTQNIRLILARVVEAIQRHVKDTEVLRLIGEDFEAILNGTIEPSRQVAAEPVTKKELDDIDEIEKMIAEL